MDYPVEDRFWASSTIVISILAECEMKELSKLSDTFPEGAKVFERLSDLRRPLEDQLEAVTWVLCRLKPGETVSELNDRLLRNGLNSDRHVLLEMLETIEDWFNPPRLSRVLRSWGESELRDRFSKICLELKSDAIVKRYCRNPLPSAREETYTDGHTYINLISRDNTVVQVEIEVAMNFQLIKRMLSDGFEASLIPVVVDADVLSKIINYCKNQKSLAMKKNLELKSIQAFERDADFIDFETEFFNMEIEEVMTMMMATDFLEFESLLHRLAKKMAEYIKKWKPSLLRDNLKIHIFLEEESALIRNEEDRDERGEPKMCLAKVLYLKTMLEDLSKGLLNQVSFDIVSVIRALLLDDKVVRKLSTPRFVQKPDTEHVSPQHKRRCV